MSKEIIVIRNIIFEVKNYELVLEYLLGKLDTNKYIIHLYKDQNNEDKYYIDITDDNYFLTALVDLETKNFKTLFRYETIIMNSNKMGYDNIERIKKVYNIEDISYNSNLNEKLKNVLFNVNNHIINHSYIFFDNYVYEITNTDKDIDKIYQIFRNNSNFKNCIVNTTGDLFYDRNAPNNIVIKKTENLFIDFIWEIYFSLVQVGLLNKADALLKYDYKGYNKKNVKLKLKRLKIRKFTEIENNSLIKQEIILLYIVFIILCDVEKEVRYIACEPESVAELIKSYLDSRKLDSNLFYSLFNEIYLL